MEMDRTAADDGATGQIVSLDGAVIDLRGLPEAPIPKDGGFAFHLSFRNIPAGAGLEAYVTRNVARSRDYWPSGGGVTLRPVPVQGDGGIDMVFTGAAASAPDDMMAFHPVEPGEYRLVVLIRDPLVDVPPMIQPPPSRIVAQYRSAPFRILGDPNVWVLTRAVQDGLMREFSLERDVYELKRYYAIGPVRRSADSLCVSYMMSRPFTGTRWACVPAGLESPQGFRQPRPEEIALTGEVAFQPGIIPFQAARASALDAARPLPSLAPPPPGGHLVALAHWVYRAAERAWFFQVTRRPPRGEEGGREHVTVRVADDGALTILAHASGGGPRLGLR